MSELRLEDVWDLARIGILLFLIYAALRALYEYRSPISLFIGAIWRRYVAVGDWRAAMERLADERVGVNDFEEEAPAPLRMPAHMSSQAQPADRSAPAVPGSGPGPDYGAVLNAVLSMDLTYDEAVRLAAAIKVGKKWWLSGKKLYSAAGGNHDSLLKNVSAIRGEIDPRTAPDDLTLTPYAGRPTRSSYYTDNPELEYQAPD